MRDRRVDFKCLLLEGDPATQILDYAHTQSFDLIALPTHGYGAFRRLFLGSVTAQVLRGATCPVWTGVHMEHLPRLEDISFKKILCAIDLGSQSCPTARWAKIARRRVWRRAGAGACGARSPPEAAVSRERIRAGSDQPGH